jgi:hypothetical protein
MLGLIGAATSSTCDSGAYCIIAVGVVQVTQESILASRCISKFVFGMQLDVFFEWSVVPHSKIYVFHHLATAKG